MKIKLNNMQYRYDVYQIINIFFSLSDIEFVEENWDLNIELGKEEVVIRHNEECDKLTLDSRIPYKDRIKKQYFSISLKKQEKKCHGDH